MKDKRGVLLGVIAYFSVLVLLYGWQLGTLIAPLPFASVIMGIVVLTLAQWKKGMSKSEMLENATQNGLFAGIIASLLSMLSDISKGTGIVPESFLPVIYGGLWYSLMRYALYNKPVLPQKEGELPSNWNTPEFIQPVLVQAGFSKRECHVALKIIQGASNKEIAEQLYISEATVKKHIQNIYKRCDVSERQDFMMWFWERSKKIKQI